MDAKEFEARYMLHLHLSLAPEAGNEHFGLVGVKGKVVIVTPLSLVLYVVPIGHLVLSVWSGLPGGIICEIDYGFGAINRNAVMGEQ